MFLRGIDKKIGKTLEKLKIRPELDLDTFKRQEKRFYTTPCFNKQGEKLLFKALISAKKEDSIRLKKEIYLLKALGNLKIIKANLKYPQWVLREYSEGKIIGHHFDLYDQSPRIRKQLADILFSLQKIKTSNLILKKKTSRDYLKKINEFAGKKIVQKEAREESLLLKNKLQQVKELLNKNNKVLCHGDFTLANFFVHQNKLFLTDWELAYQGNIASDISRTYIQTFRYPKWREALVRDFKKKLKAKALFQELFDFEVAFQAFAELSCNLLARHDNLPLQQSMRKTIKQKTI